MFKRIVTGAAIAAFFIAVGSGALFAAPPTQQPTAASRAKLAYHNVPAAASIDRDFVTKLTYGNNTEIALANLTLQQGLSANLRDYANKMLHDHAILGRELTRIAQEEHFHQPTGIDPSMVGTRHHLAKLMGAAFDRQMWNCFLKTHRGAVSLFKSEIKNGKNKAIVAFARKRLPLIESHLALAEKDTAPPPKK